MGGPCRLHVFVFVFVFVFVSPSRDGSRPEALDVWCPALLARGSTRLARWSSTVCGCIRQGLDRPRAMYVPVGRQMFGDSAFIRTCRLGHYRSYYRIMV